jgi:hypothetical protein
LPFISGYFSLSSRSISTLSRSRAPERFRRPFWYCCSYRFFKPQGILAAVLFAAIFYFILLIKDLLIIDRRSAYEILMLVLSYLLVRRLFLNVGGSFGWRRALFDSIVAAWAVSAYGHGIS